MNTLSRRALLSGAAAIVGASLARAASVSTNVPVTVIPPAPPRGPQPLPQPYPLQPGYTLVSSLDAITAAGNYQLSVDQLASPNDIYSLPAGAVIDAAGHSITKTGGLFLYTGCVIKNAAVLNTPVIINGDNATLANSSVIFSASPLPLYLVGLYNEPLANGGNGSTGSNIVLQNNYLQGASDDVVVVAYDRNTDQPVNRFQAINNIIVGAPDCGIESATRWNNCVIQNNLFRGCNIAIGDFVNTELYSCLFEGNHAEKSAATSHLFFFEASADDDVTAASYWGTNGTIFSGNSYS